MSRRTEKIGDQLQAEIAELLHREVKDPVFRGVMLSITGVQVAGDFSTARVHVSLYPAGVDEDVEVPEELIMSALYRMAPFLHRNLVKRLQMRRVPHLHFVIDRSIAEADRLAGVMRAIARGDDPES